MRKREKFQCIEQLIENEIVFDPKTLLLSLEAYLGRREMIEALEYISRVEEWKFQINSDGEIFDSESGE